MISGSLLGRRPELTAVSPGESLPKRRLRIYELNPNLHCSIVGTCLSTGDLRQLLGKLNIAAIPALSEHDLHKHGVTLANQKDAAGKLLHKALDRRHKTALNQFAKAKSEADVASLWSEAVQRGEIPGAYWAVLTHPLTGPALVKRAFGEVHMLSHLVGAAGRADIRRLRQIEEENAALREKVQRQQAQIRDSVLSRDAKIRDLNALLASAVSRNATADQGQPGGAQTLASLVASLERRLSSEITHRECIEERLAAAEERLAWERSDRTTLARREQMLRNELEAAEAVLAARSAATAEGAAEAAGLLHGQVLLYVGGKSGHVAALRDIASRFATKLLHHDGGIEDRSAQLAGLISQVSIVFFPVDCVSHDAMQLVKRLSRQAMKPYVPLRSAGLTSFLAALRAANGASARGQAVQSAEVRPA
ncbi:MAG TPA: DUF2325 domain-containing protein [Dongiaceae bacterium]|nr:DUF2325 domain-containing protein [Dongiaceae bacterium]